jgi:hypothetical protein
LLLTRKLDEKLKARKSRISSYKVKDMLKKALECAETIRHLKEEDIKSPMENWAELKKKFEGKLLSICKKVKSIYY